jgi:RecB family exonuclease
LIDVRVSNSRIKVYRRCPKQYEFKYEMGLRRKKRSVQLERGSWIHELLMVHCDGEDWRERHSDLTKKFYNLFEEEREDLGDLPRECARIMRSYVRYYSADPKRYVTIDSEMDEIVTLPNGLQLHMIIDRIAWDRRLKGNWVWDYKTRKNFEDQDNLLLDPQGGLYIDGLRALRGYEPILGFVIDEIRTKPPAVPKLTKTGRLEKRKNIDTDTYTYMAAIRKHGLNPNDYRDMLNSIAARQKDKFFRRVAMPKDPPLTKALRREALQTARTIEEAIEKGRFPRTFDRSCAWGCDYRDICIADLMGGDISSMVKMNFTSDKEQE